MKKLPVLILFIFSFISLFFIFSRTSSAAILLHDDFNDGSANDGIPVDWEEHLGSQGSWTIQEGEYVGTVVKDRPADLPTYSIAGNENWDNYQFDVRIKGDAGVDKTVLFRYRSLQETYRLVMISSWPDYYGDKIYLIKQSPTPAIVAAASFVNKQSIWYKLSIKLQSSNIKLYIDDSAEPIIDYIDEDTPILTGKIGLLTWPGFYRGYGSITVNRFDDVLVTSLGPLPSPSPTSTPTPTPLQPLILLPGLGASWNHRAIFLDEPTTQDQWKMTPFVKTYDGILQTFQSAGYTLGTNLFVFNYDWRKQISQIADDLKGYISVTVRPPPSTEIDLVGHSLGGMVARTYLQDNPNDHHVDQVITLGSPHRGAPQVYYLWEGADFNKSLGFAWQRIGAGILLQLKKRGFKNNVSALQHAVSGLQDLLPAFPYLRQKGVEKPLEEINQRNLWLESLNILPFPPHFPPRLTSVAGTNLNTLRWLNIQKRTNFDELLGKWEDGRPVEEEFASGDRTVLEMSAELLGEVDVTRLSELNHGDLVESESGQQEVIRLLGLSPSTITEASTINYEPSLVFQLASPAKMVVTGPNGWQIGEGVTNTFPDGFYDSDENLIIIPSPPEGNYEVQVTEEDGGGDYRLLIGNINDQQDIWQEESGQVGEGETQNHQVNYSLDPETNKLALLKSAKERLRDAKKKTSRCQAPPKKSLVQAINTISKQINKASVFIRKNKEVKASQEIENAITGLISLEEDLRFGEKICSLEIEEEILFLLREARDYLLQAQEL